MTRVLIAGIAPLPFEEVDKNYGPGIRTWQLARGLADAGHDVRVLAMTLDDAYAGRTPRAREEVDGVVIERCTPHELLVSDRPQRLMADLRPEAVVGATVYGAYAIARFRPEQPFWADQFGHVMAEAQAKAFLDRDNRAVGFFWRALRPVLAWADHFSVVSERQRWAAIGELGAAGRLLAETTGHELVSVMPCAHMPSNAAAPPATTPRRREDPFVVLWSGSFNTWSDVDTLATALEEAMRRDTRIRFLATGGSIPGHDESTYRRFVERVEASPFRERFELRGWVPTSDLPRIVGQAHLGVLCERPIYEGALGSKNRVVQWLAQGLPVAYNRIGDLGEHLANEAIGLTFPPGDAAALAAAIRDAADRPEEMVAMAQRATAWVNDHGSIGATTAPLVTWVESPRPAPDASVKGRFASPDAWEHADPGATPDATPPAAPPPGTGASSWGRRAARRILRRLRPNGR